jgi:hypothetical protein
MIEGSGELHFAIPGDVLREKILKLTLYRALLDALLLQITQLDQTLRLSYSMNSGMLSIDGAMEVAGDRDLQLEEELGNEGG